MSLDLARQTGVAYQTTAPITAVAGLTASIFASADVVRGRNSVFVVKVSTALGHVDLSGIGAPSTFPFIEDGNKIEFIKATADTNRILANDTATAVTTPYAMVAGTNFNQFTGVQFTFCDGQGERLTLVADITTNKWGVL